MSFFSINKWHRMTNTPPKMLIIPRMGMDKWDQKINMKLSSSPNNVYQENMTAFYFCQNLI